MLKQRATPGILQPDVLGDGRGNQPWLPDRRQRNEIHAVGKIAGHLRRQPDAKARLATAARAGQREEAVVAQKPSRFRQLMLPADKAGEWPGQVVRGVVQGPARERRYLSLSDRSARHLGIRPYLGPSRPPGYREFAHRQARTPPSQTLPRSVRRIGPA